MEFNRWYFRDDTFNLLGKFLFLSGDNDRYASQDGEDADGKLEGETRRRCRRR